MRVSHLYSTSCIRHKHRTWVQVWSLSIPSPLRKIYLEMISWWFHPRRGPPKYVLRVGVISSVRERGRERERGVGGSFSVVVVHRPAPPSSHPQQAPGPNRNAPTPRCILFKLVCSVSSSLCSAAQLQAVSNFLIHINDTLRSLLPLSPLACSHILHPLLCILQ